MHIELNDDQTRALIQTLLFEIEATKQLLSMEEDYSKRMEESMDERDGELVTLKAEIKALKAPQTAKPAKVKKAVKPVAPVAPVKRGRGRPKKMVK